MKQIIEIEVPEGKKAIWKDNKVVFEDIESQLYKTWEEFCNNYSVKNCECFINNSSHISEPGCTDRGKYSDKNILPSKKAAEQHLALMQLHQLRDCYRQGWTPDWEDDSCKYSIGYTIYNKIGKYSIGWCYNTPYFLSFPTQKLAEEFLTNFYKLVEQAGDLI